ncbi:MAG: ribosomal L7Ae/L30e/S12e/Gadd45 family protein [Lachnospiraceae bacterium]|nr:ribosomal L7Ae/L30e/S12e/Gadd45 family protein [Lachnospiraceae bacterium]
MNKKGIFSFLGLAAKAGRIASGEFATERSIKTGHSYLVMIAEDASDNTKKMFDNMCHYYQVPLTFIGTKDELGHCIGKQYRSSLSIEDEGFANAIMKKLGINGNMEV